MQLNNGVLIPSRAPDLLTNCFVVSSKTCGTGLVPLETL